MSEQSEATLGEILRSTATLDIKVTIEALVALKDGIETFDKEAAWQESWSILRTNKAERLRERLRTKYAGFLSVMGEFQLRLNNQRIDLSKQAAMLRGKITQYRDEQIVTALCDMQKLSWEMERRIRDFLNNSVQDWRQEMLDVLEIRCAKGTPVDTESFMVCNQRLMAVINDLINECQEYEKQRSHLTGKSETLEGGTEAELVQ